MTRFSLPILIALALVSADAEARTIWRCLRDGTVSLSTAAEPGSRCSAETLDDNAALLPNLWGSLGVFQGTLYRREQDGSTVYGTRRLPGSVAVQAFTVTTPAQSPAHVGLGKIGQPRLEVFRQEFKAAARKTGIDEAWLRAIAHAESAYDANAVSSKGAVGVMQLMPSVISDYAVKDANSAAQSILAGARLLQTLETRYGGDRILVAAAYTPASARSRNTAACRRMPKRANTSPRSTCSKGASAAGISLIFLPHPTLSEPVGIAAEVYEGANANRDIPTKKWFSPSGSGPTAVCAGQGSRNRSEARPRCPLTGV